MKQLKTRKSNTLFTVLLFVIFFTSRATSQIITINSTFTENEELNPFGSTGEVYGLSITGNIELYSDTSLVRVVLFDNEFNEYLVYEAYPYICSTLVFDITNGCDETCYSEGLIPYSIEIQVENAEITLSTIIMTVSLDNDATTQQEQTKIDLEHGKVTDMRNIIEQHQMLWFADTNTISNLTYSQKRSLFGDNYNMCGLDYYVGGIFDPEPNAVRQQDNSDLVPNFDWRNRHGANDTSKEEFYYVDGRDGEGWLTSIKDQSEITDCKGLCYIYGPLATVEGVANIYFNQYLDYNLSVQNVLECKFNNGYGDCSGGIFGGTLGEVKETGVVNTETYPRRFPNKGCWQDLDPLGYLYKVSIADFKRVILNIPDPEEIEKTKIALIEKGSLAVSVDEYSNDAGHTMALVGYGTLEEGDTIYDPLDNFEPIPILKSSGYIGSLYWIFKNSWTTNFGDNG